jgi:hypothetical protein
VTVIGLPLCYVNLGLLAFRLWASIDCAIIGPTLDASDDDSLFTQDDIIISPIKKSKPKILIDLCNQKIIKGNQFVHQPTLEKKLGSKIGQKVSTNL